MSIFIPILVYSLVTFAFLYALWVFYLAVMNLGMAKKANRLSKCALIFGTPILVIGLIIDFICNILITIPFLDLPRETTVTARLQRYVRGKEGWRKRFTLWFADDMLDDFDPNGKHIY